MYVKVTQQEYKQVSSNLFMTKKRLLLVTSIFEIPNVDKAFPELKVVDSYWKPEIKPKHKKENEPKKT